MMRFVVGLSVLLGFAAGFVQADDLKEVKAEKEWAGKFPKAEDEALMKQAPESGFIANAKDWEKLWKAWRKDEELPKIDFQKSFIVVGTVSCAGNQLGGGFQLKDGEMKGNFFATMMAGPGFAYRLVQLPRSGVKSYNGKAIPKAD